MRDARIVFILTNGLSDYLFAGKNLFRYDEVIRNRCKLAFHRKSSGVVEPGCRGIVCRFFFHFVLVEGIEFLQLLVRIGVHGAELQEVEYPVVTAYTLRLIDDFTLTFETGWQWQCR